jgi:hypothetical protein
MVRLLVTARSGVIGIPMAMTVVTIVGKSVVKTGAKNAVKTVVRNVKSLDAPTTTEMAIVWTSTVTVGTLIAYPSEAAHGRVRVAAHLLATALISCRGVFSDGQYLYPTYYRLKNRHH